MAIWWTASYRPYTSYDIPRERNKTEINSNIQSNSDAACLPALEAVAAATTCLMIDKCSLDTNMRATNGIPAAAYGMS